MKFIKEKFPSEEDFYPEDEGFIPMKEPDQKKFMIWMNIFVVLLSILVLIVIENIYGDINIIILAITLIFIIVPHELIHALCFPEHISSDKVVIGSYIKGGVFFAHYSGEMTKGRFLKVLIAPFIILTIIPALFCVFVSDIEILRYLSIANGLGAVGDIFGFFLVLKNVPKYGVVRNKGYKTYYKI